MIFNHSVEHKVNNGSILKFVVNFIHYYDAPIFVLFDKNNC